MTAIIVPIDMGRKYKSAAVAGSGVGAGVAAGASTTPTAVSANEPKRHDATGVAKQGPAESLVFTSILTKPV